MWRQKYYNRAYLHKDILISETAHLTSNIPKNKTDEWKKKSPEVSKYRASFLSLAK